MSLIKSKQLDVLIGTIRQVPDAFTLAAAGSVTVTASFAGKTAGGNNTTSGVATTSPQNKVVLIRADNGEIVTDDQGTQVYGRLTEAAGVWTITYYTTDGAGGESAFTFATEDAVGKLVDIRYPEVVQLKDVNPLDVVNGLDDVDESDFDPSKHQHQVDGFAATAAQTSFTLTQTPKNNVNVLMKVNGVDYRNGVGKDFTVSGTTATWLNALFALEVDDDVLFVYEY